MKNEVIPYKKGLFQRFIGKIKSFFEKETNNIDVIKKQEVVSEKQEIMKLYENIKNGQTDFENVDIEKLYKVMILLNEEITILNSKLTDKIDNIQSQIENIKSMI